MLLEKKKKTSAIKDAVFGVLKGRNLVIIIVTGEQGRRKTTREEKREGELQGGDLVKYKQHGVTPGLWEKKGSKKLRKNEL